MSKKFNTPIYKAYLQEIQIWLAKNPKINIDLYEPKLSRKVSGAPFSIVRMYYRPTETFRYFAVSRIHMATGANGRVKIAFPLMLDKENKRAKLMLSAPVALKVLNPTGADKEPVTDVGLEYLEETYPELFAFLQRTPTPEAVKKYYTLPLYKICLIDFLAAKKGSLDPRLVLLIIYKIALQVERLHASGRVHLDIKPDNIMVQFSKGFVTVALVDIDGVVKVGTKIPRCGTLEYMAPELDILAPKVKIEAAYSQDIYSLGCTLEIMFSHASTALHQERKYQETVSRLRLLIGNMVENAPSLRSNIETISVSLKTILSKVAVPLLLDHPLGAQEPIFASGEDVDFDVRILPSTRSPNVTRRPLPFCSSPTHKKKSFVEIKAQGDATTLKVSSRKPEDIKVAAKEQQHH